MGEGAGIVVLKRLADASHDGDRVYAIIRGSGCSNDGRSDGPMTPRADGQLKAIERAYHDAENVPTSSIGYIEAHGTATTVGDAVELSALNTFFDRSRPATSDEACCFIGSIKANIGHAMSAAGVAGFINSVLALQHAVIPPHASLTSPNPALKFDQSVFRLATTQQSWPDVGTSPRRAAVSSFGFGGTNAHMILEQGSDSAQSAVEREELFLVSAPTPELLSRHLADLADAIEYDSISPAVVAFTLAHRVIFECRMAFVASNSAAMLLRLRQASRAAAKEIENFAGLGNGKLADVGRSFIRDGKSNAMQLMQASDYRLGTLPPTPLERQRYWAIEPAERPYWGASGKSHGFQAEAAISSSPEQAQASLTISAAEIETHHQIEKYILTSVAGITAFPLQRLRLDQRLVGELGFDSLMLADLEEDIRKQWPRASKLPFEILPPETTIADVVRYVLQQLRSVASENDERETEGNSQTARARISALLSRSNDKYLNDHVISGHCVLPFAVAMNYLASAATQWMNTKASAGFVITGFHAVRPVIVYETTQLEISSPVRAIDPANDKIEINLDQDGTTRYRAAFSASRPAPKEIKPVRGDAPSLSLQDFYEHGTFHGPLLRGIFSINEVSDVGIGGKVFTSKPRDWIKHPTIQEWTIDPLAIDGGFQLAAYWIWVKHGLPAIPTRFDEYIQFGPLSGGTVSCSVKLETAADGKFQGSATWHDNGNVLAAMSGIVAETKSSFGLRAARASDREASATSASTIRDYTEQFPELKELRSQMQLAEKLGISNPYFRIPQGASIDLNSGNAVKEVNFSSYNYLGTSGDAVVSAAAVSAIEQYGTSVSASRLASGERALHSDLENELAAFLGTDRCLVFTSGHATNVSVIGHLVASQDLILHDALAHDSIIQGAKLSGAKRRSFPHNDIDALDRMLTELRHQYRRTLICIEGVYSMDGDIPDLPGFVEVKDRHKALLFIDEAHSLGVIGKSGRGISEYHNVPRSSVDIWMGTLSKSFASCGGFIGGSSALIELLKHTTPGFIYSVGITPPNAAAALAALRQLINHPERVQRLQRQSAMFLGLLKERGIETGLSKDTAVIPAVIGDSLLCLKVANALHARGINVHPIIYPAVSNESARLRFFITCEHTDEQLERAADILIEELRRLTS
jgi:8-amino-7-oxononanoate synthase